ncbi:T9SS type A sorting domain-containing protein [Flavobacterium sp. Sd200]|uniref:type IX secretion system anionic LPS delivery protein PorZ n=1 Tax=Flavobacterium sp. Sd200 TaxID=2692211 RepID=UPI001369F64C|nr:T9SS type A sorting domain-containing protein [Flavobacterium sp. Sd200]MXN91310.1 T9SS type A sorting domain-containing protein [Flavobacterium sp. Sd200]
MKHFLRLLIFFFCIGINAQSNRQQWGSYFSYTNVVDMSQSESRFFCTSESAAFIQNIVSGELKTITSVDGLKGEGITAIYHSSEYNRTLVGNSNGLLLIINANNSIVSRRGIVEETTVVATKKKINSFYENNGLVYICTDFGIVVFNLETLEFGDTFYLGPNGSEIPVRQATIYEGNIYAATFLGYGIKKGRLNNPNLNDYNQWDTVYPGYWWNGIVTFGNMLIAVDNAGDIARFVNDNRVAFGALLAPGTDLRVSGQYLIATSASKIIVYNAQLQQVLQINAIPNETDTITYTRATVVGPMLYIGTKERGVFTVPLDFSAPFENITPDGPLRNNVFSIQKSRNNLWAVFGTYSYMYVPGLEEYGVSKFTSRGWVNIPYSTLSAFGPLRSISDITIHPNREREVYLNSFHNGLLKLEDDVPVIMYTDAAPNGTKFEPVIDGSYRSIRINGGTFDANGNLWMTNGRVTEPLKMLPASGTMQEFSLANIMANEKDEFGKLVIDKNGTKWIPTFGSGLVAFNESLGNKGIVINMDSGLPNIYVKCVEIDNSNRLWIGTVSGLRIIQSVDRFVTENTLEATNIVFLEDGVAQELMYEQSITDIKTDGSNNKWIATAGAGAFLVSPDGQSTLFHFTKDNSPLPSNNINDIEIDDTTGEVFFATDRGMVSYKGTSTAAEDDLNNVYVYPNPVRPGFEGDVKISGLVNRANVKITDIEGNLVYEATSEGGTILWDTRAFGKYKVRSGVYMIFISSEDATLTKVKKVMIVR